MSFSVVKPAKAIPLIFGGSLTDAGLVGANRVFMSFFFDLYGRPVILTVNRYPLAREGVYSPGGHAFLAHTKQKVSNIVGLSALRLAFFMGYE